MSSISRQRGKLVEEQSTTVRPVCACWYYERSNSIFIGPRCWYYELLVFRTPPKYAGVLQSGASSRAKHGGAYFSAVYGSIEDPMAAPGPY